MNKGAWAMTAPLVVLVALLVASCGADSPTGSSPVPTLPSADVEPRLTLVGSGLTPASEAPLAGVYVHGNYAYVGGMSVGYKTPPRTSGCASWTCRIPRTLPWWVAFRCASKPSALATRTATRS